MALDHTMLCVRATGWLRQNGGVVVCGEMGAWACAERPDVIGWDFQGKSTVLEVKVHRGDFLADKHKPWRKDGVALGQRRYYVAPKGLIDPSELPDGWGLVVAMGACSLRKIVQSAEHEPNLLAERVLLTQVCRYMWNESYRLKHFVDVSGVRPVK